MDKETYRKVEGMLYRHYNEDIKRVRSLRIMQLEEERMKFSKENFINNAPLNVRKTLKDRLDILDNLEVDFDFDDRYGTINYKYSGQDECLYPIYKEWCK